MHRQINDEARRIAANIAKLPELQKCGTSLMLPYDQRPVAQREPLTRIVRNRCTERSMPGATLADAAMTQRMCSRSHISARKSRLLRMSRKFESDNCRSNLSDSEVRFRGSTPTLLWVRRQRGDRCGDTAGGLRVGAAGGLRGGGAAILARISWSAACSLVISRPICS